MEFMAHLLISLKTSSYYKFVIYVEYEVYDIRSCYSIYVLPLYCLLITFLTFNPKGVNVQGATTRVHKYT